MSRTHNRIDSPLGELTLVNADGALLVSTSRATGTCPIPTPSVCARSAASSKPNASWPSTSPASAAASSWAFELSGAPLQMEVWRRLLEIPYGETATYGEIAGRLEESLYGPDLEPYRRPRVVGAAIGANPVPVVVPCHRVIGADGSLTGYFGGVERKRLLLELEAERSWRCSEPPLASRLPAWGPVPARPRPGRRSGRRARASRSRRTRRRRKKLQASTWMRDWVLT